MEKAISENYDVLISKYYLQDMDAIKVHEILLERSVKSPLIIFDIFSTKNAIINALNSGISRWISKIGDPGGYYTRLMEAIIEEATKYRQSYKEKKLLRIYNSLICSMEEPVLVLSEKSILLANDAFCRLAGIDKDKLEWNDLEALLTKISERDEERVKKIFKKIFQGVIKEIQFQIQYKKNIDVILFLDVTIQRIAFEELVALHIRIQKVEESVEEDIDDIVLMLDYKMNIIYINETAQKYIPHEVEEDTHSQLLSIFPFIRKHPILDMLIHVLKERESASRVFQYTLSDHTKKWFIVSAYPVEKGILCAAKDITKWKQEEIAVQESEKRFRLLYEEAPLAYLSLDSEQRIVRVNPEWTHQVGYEQDEVIGSKFEVYLAPSSKESYIKALEKLREKTEIHDLMLDIIKSDKSIVKARFDGKLSQTVDGTNVIHFIFHDVTEREISTEILRKSEERFRHLFESIPNIALIWERMPDGTIILSGINEQAHDIIEERRFEEIGKSASEILTEEQLVVLRKAMDGEIKQIPEEEIDATRDKIWALTEFSKPSEDMLLHTIIDVTDIKETSEKLARQKEELSAFAHQMKHDLNNRMINILGFASLLLEEFEKEYLYNIEKIVKEMQELLEKSVKLADAGLIVGAMENVDLNILVDDVALSVIPSKIEFKSDKLPEVRGDPIKLAQVFQNLFVNAIVHGAATEITIKLEEKLDAYHILISNNGKQIPEKIRERILDTRYSSKIGGGLGLQIVRRIIDAHDWTIELDDSSRVTFRIIIDKIT